MFLLRIQLSTACVNNLISKCGPINDYRYIFQSGFDIRSNYIRNCNGDSDPIIKIYPNSSIIINSNCELISNVCNDVKKFTKFCVSLNTFLN